MILEVVPHVQLAEAMSHSVLRAPVMEQEMEGVVDHVTEVEPGRYAPGDRCPEYDDEESEECQCQGNREGWWENQSPWIVWMIVVNAMDHPVHSSSDPRFGLEMEDGPVSPVLAKCPEEVPTS